MEDHKNSYVTPLWRRVEIFSVEFHKSDIEEFRQLFGTVNID